ncbi:TraR/DksA C4-type zinc finger protein [Leifsonia sp. TF02-11]|uniref:TraR/DksA family transcriptional regulator n=1 Tax=Leifsonia sp. TF02-11 TaxID=2815212 RepID=UPI001AA1960C|nr:TraR/DksA C4-type zinc finger protein [Leifsonia sp. TF02-11]MBO1739828.1 TraR/DksA C4-type zinc finger protein [Leifsonia sp. TF02-11]
MHTESPDTRELYIIQDAGLTIDELDRFDRMLDERRQGDVAESQRHAEALGSLLSSRSESTADDEHDPEGPTLSAEWSRLQALRSETAADIAAVDAARERIRVGRYGTCASCGRAIGVQRLEARPTTELCIVCAIAAER